MALATLYGDVARYKKLLDEVVVQTGGDEAEKYKQLAALNVPDRLRIATTVLMSPERSHMDLVYPLQDAEESPEEYVVNLQGYIVQCRLPPILNPNQLGSNPSQARQSVTLTGLGSTEFDQAAEAIMKIYRVFEDTCGQGQMLPWVPRQEGGHIVVTVANRFFTPSSATSTLEVQPLSDQLDPFHILRNAVPDGVHTTNNEVLYFERSGSAATKYQYKPVAPSTIKLGQLVQLQIGFTSAVAKRGKHVFLPLLRSVCIIDRSVEQDMNTAILDAVRAKPIQPTRLLKRRVGYDQDDSEQVSVTFKRMRVNAEDTE